MSAARPGEGTGISSFSVSSGCGERKWGRPNILRGGAQVFWSEA